MEPRYILCRPRGGLNDMLCQIEKCCVYAQKYDRKVVVDTNYKSIQSFQNKLSDYFTSLQNNLILDLESVSDQLDTNDLFPESISGRINDYTGEYRHRLKRKGALFWYYNRQQKKICPASGVYDETNSLITFDFKRDYKHQILLHDQAGGGESSIYALLRMKLHHDINTQLAQRVDQIGQPYIAIHIRNTDYTTDYLDGLKSIQNEHHLPYFIATDSADALEDCRQILGTDNTYNFTKVLSKDGSPIHQNPTHENNIDAITDLLMLALGKQFIRFRLNQNRNRTDYSGFSRLAFNLHERRQVLEHLIQHRTPLISKLLWHA